MTKTISAGLDRDWDWTIHKVAKGDSPYRADEAGDVTIGYDVTVTPAPRPTPTGRPRVPSASGTPTPGRTSRSRPSTS
ncbi:DUF908 domain-containing protein [Tessaracoccus sp. HDW20]|uniref:hypothetical protein n=1 Tax=Tessaracoccus coleopterorum TaxID=2714950 RepID=UPI0018D3D1A5|nr:hypothetical protein [Tessaracoccus coleopterorum]NHB84651.1 DUF908 domain-containing protein [Tessaracoccus coleopterorum]